MSQEEEAPRGDSALAAWAARWVLHNVGVLAAGVLALLGLMAVVWLGTVLGATTEEAFPEGLGMMGLMLLGFVVMLLGNGVLLALALGEWFGKPKDVQRYRRVAFGWLFWGSVALPFALPALAMVGNLVSLMAGNTAHGGDVNSVAFSPEGTLMASGGKDQAVIVWEVATGRKKWHTTERSGVVNSVCFSPDGATLAVGTEGKTVVLREVATGKQLSELAEPAGPVQSVAYSPNGSLLAVGSPWTVRLWDVGTGKVARELPGGRGAVCFDAEGRLLVSQGFNDTALLWQVSTGKRKEALQARGGAAVSLSPDGKWVAMGGAPIVLVEVATGAQRPLVSEQS